MEWREDQRKSVSCPGKEVDPKVHRPLDDSGGNGIGRRSHQSPEATDGRREGDAEDERARKAAGLPS